MRWSSKFVKKSVAPSRQYDPPPYSWTLLRTLKPEGMASRGSPSHGLKTRTVRPSCGRDSSQYTPSSHGSGRSKRLQAAPVEATRSALIGDDQDPYGASSTGVGYAHARPRCRG